MVGDFNGADDGDNNGESDDGGDIDSGGDSDGNNGSNGRYLNPPLFPLQKEKKRKRIG